MKNTKWIFNAEGLPGLKDKEGDLVAMATKVIIEPERSGRHYYPGRTYYAIILPFIRQKNSYSGPIEPAKVTGETIQELINRVEKLIENQKR